jgi:hypothetical protein
MGRPLLELQYDHTPGDRICLSRKALALRLISALAGFFRNDNEWAIRAVGKMALSRPQPPVPSGVVVRYDGNSPSVS